MFRSSIRARAAWVALCAVLFSGFSSTLAVLYFQGRSDILAEICTTSGVKKILSSIDGANHHAPGNASGGIYCAQCLASASAPAIETPPVVALFALVAGGAPPHAVNLLEVRANPVLVPPSRGPPQDL